MSFRKAERDIRDDLHKAVEKMQALSMTSDFHIPWPKRRLISGAAAALFEQWLELEAARFNLATSEYRDAAAGVRSALASLQKEIDDLEEAIEAVSRATSVFASVDQLLQVANKFTSLGN